jgi:hypothetical protein
MSTDEPGTAPKSSWKREVPSPWIDCASCGWRHYPDTGQRRGPSFPETCSSCGAQLAQPPRDEPS